MDDRTLGVVVVVVCIVGSMLFGFMVGAFSFYFIGKRRGRRLERDANLLLPNEWR